MNIYKPDRPEILKKLMPRHLKIIELVLEGLKLGDIANKVDMSVVQLKNIRNSPTFQHELSMRQESYNSLHDQNMINVQLETAEEVIQDNQLPAAEMLRDILKGEDTAMQFRAAESLLDRGGHPKVQKQDTTSRSIVIALDAGKLDLINETLKLDT